MYDVALPSLQPSTKIRYVHNEISNFDDNFYFQWKFCYLIVN